MSEWQPIETAPPNKWLLVACSGYMAIPAYWHSTNQEWISMDERELAARPTHWMPLPRLNLSTQQQDGTNPANGIPEKDR